MTTKIIFLHFWKKTRNCVGFLVKTATFWAGLKFQICVSNTVSDCQSLCHSVTDFKNNLLLISVNDRCWQLATVRAMCNTLSIFDSFIALRAMSSSAAAALLTISSCAAHCQHLMYSISKNTIFGRTTVYRIFAEAVIKTQMGTGSLIYKFKIILRIF